MPALPTNFDRAAHCEAQAAKVTLARAQARREATRRKMAGRTDQGAVAILAACDAAVDAAQQHIEKGKS